MLFWYYIRTKNDGSWNGGSGIEAPLAMIVDEVTVDAVVSLRETVVRQ